MAKRHTAFPAFLLISVLTVLFLSSCENNTPPDSESQSAPPPQQEAPEPPEATAGISVEEIQDILSGFYSPELIQDTAVSSDKIEVTISAAPDATLDAMPSTWANDIDAALAASVAVHDKAEVSNSIIYLSDSAGNYFLTVLNGRIAYDAFEKHTAAYADNPPTISLDEYTRIKTGMAYQEVFDIVGSRGNRLTEVDLGYGDEFYTSTYTFDGEGSIGANAVIMFQRV